MDLRTRGVGGGGGIKRGRCIVYFRLLQHVVRSCLKYSTGPGPFEVVQGEEKNSFKFIMQSIQLPSYEGGFLKAFSDALR